jgi:hypothetical protein
MVFPEMTPISIWNDVADYRNGYLSDRGLAIKFGINIVGVADPYVAGLSATYDAFSCIDK